MTTLPSREPPDTYEQWRAQLVPAPAPALLTARARAALTPAERELHDETRIAYHQRFVTVATPGLRDVVTKVRKLRLLDRRSRGLMISDDSRTGKTEAMLAAGRAFDLDYRKRTPNNDDDIPVGYTIVPPNPSPKTLVSEIARFFALDLIGNRTELMNSIVTTMNKKRTRMWLFDDIHNLHRRTVESADTTDQIKYFGDRTGVTLVIAGIDLERLFAGMRDDQILGRFRAASMRPFRYTTAEDRAVWDALISDFETALRLYQHTPGTLRKLGPYLHARSGGRIGALSDLICEAALAAVGATEEITLSSLDEVDSNAAVERGTQDKGSALPRPPRTASGSRLPVARV